MTTKWISLPLAAFLLAALGGVAAADSLRLSKGFTPNPTVTKQITTRVDKTHVLLSKLGYGCDRTSKEYTTNDPAFTFEVTSDLPDLRVNFEDSNGDGITFTGVIVGTQYFCTEYESPSSIYMKDLPKGTYRVWFATNSDQTIDLTARLRFEMPSRAVAEGFAAAPTIGLGTQGGENPRYVSLKVKTADTIDVRSVGCTGLRDQGYRYSKSKTLRIMPIASLDVAKDAYVFFTLRDASTQLFVVAGNGACLYGTDFDLAAGRHQLWAVAPNDGLPSSLLLEVDDREHPLVFGVAPRRVVNDLSKPLILDGTVRAAGRWPSRLVGCDGAAQDPDFYLTSDQDHVQLSLVWSRTPQVVHLVRIKDKKTTGGARTQDIPDASCNLRSDKSYDLAKDETYVRCSPTAG